MKMRNLVREKIAQNGYALGAFVASSSAMNCEILGLNGLDFVIILSLIHISEPTRH